jgi:outer membrane receptor protein involved in Fe transport
MISLALLVASPAAAQGDPAPAPAGPTPTASPGSTPAGAPPAAPAAPPAESPPPLPVAAPPPVESPAAAPVPDSEIPDSVDTHIGNEQLSLEDLLNPTVFTATKSVLTLEQTPSIVSVFRREDIERLGVRQLIDLLRFVPGFYEVSSQLERNFAIRGIHAASPSHFVILLDGLPLNDFLFSSASPESLSLEFAERVEIIRGPGSAIYGANALMGVINVITRRPDEGSFARGSVTAGTNGQIRTDLSFASGTAKGRGFYGAATFWRQGGTKFGASPTEDVLTPSLGQNIADGIHPGENLTGPRAGVDVPINGYGPSYNIFLKYQEDGSAIRLLATRSDFRLQRTYRQALYAPEPYTETPNYVNERLVLDLEKQWGKREELGELTARASLLLFGHEMKSQAIAPQYYEPATREGAPLIYGWSGRDLRINPSIEYAVELPNFLFFHQNSLVAGVQAEYDVAAGYHTTQCSLDRDKKFPPSRYAGDSSTSAADLFCVESLMLREGVSIDPFGTIRQTGSSRFGDGDELRLGGFFQLSTALPAGLGLVVGGRVDYNVTYAPQFSPRVALVAPFGGGLYSKVQYSSGFVYPAFLYRTGNSLSDYQGNADVNPQTVRALEGLVGFKTGSTRTELSGYYNTVSDFITFDLSRNARTGQYFFSNQGDLKVVGVEATTMLRWLDGRLDFDLHGSFARPLASTTDKFVVDGQLGGPTKFPQWLGVAVLSGLPLPGLRLEIDTSVSSRVKQTLASEVQFYGIQGTDGQVHSSQAANDYDTRDLTVNASAAYSFLQRWRVEAGATNLLNRRGYRPGSVLVPYLAEGRRVSATVSVSY